MRNFIIYWLVVAISLWVASSVLPGVTIVGWQGLLIGSLVLGFINSSVRPLLTFLTLPVTVLTLGLFYLVVNGVAFALAAWLVPSFQVDGFGWAMLGAMVVAVTSWFVGGFLRSDANS